MDLELLVLLVLAAAVWIARIYQSPPRWLTKHSRWFRELEYERRAAKARMWRQEWEARLDYHTDELCRIATYNWEHGEHPVRLSASGLPGGLSFRSVLEEDLMPLLNRKLATSALRVELSDTREGLVFTVLPILAPSTSG